MNKLNLITLRNKTVMNIVLNIIIKGFATLISFLIINSSIKYFTNNGEYGVWLTLLSILTWISVFDFGIGNGLRNNFLKSYLKKDFIQSKKYISTSYFVVSIIALSLICFFLVLYNFLDIGNFMLNKDDIQYKNEVNFAIKILVIGTIINFVLQLINPLMHAFQKSYIPGLISLLSNILFYISIICSDFFFKGNIINISMMYISSVLFINILSNVVFYKNVNIKFRPSINTVDRKLFKNTLNLGYKFFLLQLFALILFSTDSFLALKLLDGSTVTEYQITLKIFSICTIIFSLVMGPIWTVFSKHFFNDEKLKLIGVMKKIFILFIILSIFSVILIFFNNTFLTILTSGELKNIDYKLSISICVYTIITMWINIFAYFSNSIGKVNTQIITMGIGALLNIPLSIFLVEYLNFGIEGIIIATIISQLPFCLLGPVQTFNEIKKMR